MKTQTHKGREEKKCEWFNICGNYAVKGSSYCSAKCWSRSNVINGNSTSGRPV
jgi:hypothetical protein